MAIFNFENPAESLLLPFPLLFVVEVRKKQNRQFAAGAASPCADHDVHQHFFWDILIFIWLLPYAKRYERLQYGKSVRLHPVQDIQYHNSIHTVLVLSQSRQLLMMTSIFSPCACFFCPRWSFNLFESSIDALSPSWTTYDPPLHLTSLLWPDLGETHRAEIDDMTTCKLFSVSWSEKSAFRHFFIFTGCLAISQKWIYLLSNPLPNTFIITCTQSCETMEDKKICFWARLACEFATQN